MAATLTQERFVAPGWIFERKFDGIRLIAYKQGSEVRLYSRNRLLQNGSYPSIVSAVEALAAPDAVLDGEATGVWGSHGRVAYHVFDILFLNGRLLTGLPLEARRAILAKMHFRLPLEHVSLLDGPAPWDKACREGWEGVIAKRIDSPYEHRRSKQWLKMKCEASQELVVGGFTDPQRSRVGLGALLVGYYEGDDLVFAGKVGTGFDTRMLRELRQKLDAIEIPEAPFTKAVGLPRIRVHWVRPKLVVQVAFIEWTVHDKLRHPRLLGIRSDKSPREVVRETT
jgi:ATP-dependent DNA ligase